MTIRKLISTSLVAAVIAFGGTTLLAGAAQATTPCANHSSSSQTYGGQGTQIGQLGCAPSQPTPPSSSSALPFTGLDIGLLVAAGAVLVAGGLTLRWRLQHHGGQ